MKVADSSYLFEGILRDTRLIENETFVTPDLAVYEVANALWKHETLIRDVKNSSPYLAILVELIENRNVELIRPDRKLLDETYALSPKHKMPIYDAVFVALALELDLELKTFDQIQAKAYSRETKTASSRS